MEQKVGSGGFFFPVVYREDPMKVLEALHRGEQDLVEASRWTLSDEFLAFILEVGFLPFADQTYPTPRKKTEIPIWFLVSCQLAMKIHLQKSYQALGALLHAGPILSRVGFNVLAPIGFNEKNRFARQTPVHPDSVRKFFKDTKVQKMREWFCIDLQRWFQSMGCFDPTGVFILDQTHIVVPRNAHYQDAVFMPVDEHGQRYPDYDEMSEEQRKALRYHPCYTLSTLLHLSFQKQAFHIAGYEWGAGNADEIPQAEKIIETFSSGNPRQRIKLLIVDRGYICGTLITKLKKVYGIDVLCPLKKTMHQYIDALALSKMDDANWSVVTNPRKISGLKSRVTRACIIENIALWDECEVPLYTTVVEITETTEDGLGVSTRHFVLCSTKKFDTPHAVVESYALRTQTEECFRTLKNSWSIGEFPSPNRSLLEAHVGFTLLTYSLLQLYLMRKDLQKKTNKHIATLKREEHRLEKTTLVYAASCFAQFKNAEYLKLILNLPQEAREKLTRALDASPHQT
jgi:hypothetical protein